MRARWRRPAALLPVVLPPLIFVLLYLRALDYPFVWTDHSAIGGGTMLRPAGETLQAFGEPLHRIEHRGSAARQPYYRPLPVVILSLVDQALGREPSHFRAVTVAVGALCLAAFGLFAWALFGRAGPALFAALFAAVHPVAIESTVWITGVAAALCTLFTIAALGLALASRDSRSAVAAPALGVLSIAALAAALLSKERAVVEPALLVAAFLATGARRRPVRAAVLLVSHALLVGVYVFALRPAVLGRSLAELAPIGGSASTQVLSGLASWPGRLAWLFAPLHSSTSDVVRVVDSLADPGALVGLILAAGSVLGWVLLLRAGRPLAALGLAWIWIAYAPTSGLLPMLHATGERYLYLSAFGAALLLADLGSGLLSGGRPRWRRLLVPALAALLLAGLAQRTLARIPDWRSTRALFERDLGRDPAYREAYFLLAAEDFYAGRAAEAEARLRPVLGPCADFEGTSSYLNPLATAELACLIKLALGRYGEVLDMHRRLGRENPAVAWTPTVRICVAQAHDGLERTEEALAIYVSVARELGEDTPPRVHLMIARDHARLGRRAPALEWLGRAERFGAGDAELQREARRLRAYLRRMR